MAENSVLAKLMSSIYEAKQKLSKAEDARDSFLEPILRKLGATGGGISHCSIDSDILHVTRSGSCRGCGWDDDYRFPLAIFTCKDPLTAAEKYVAAKNESEELAARTEKLRTIKRLQEELGGTKV